MEALEGTEGVRLRPPAPGRIGGRSLEEAIRAARRALASRQRDDGHWCFPLEADATIPAETIVWQHFLDEIDPELERKLAAFLRGRQGADGGWPLYHGGALDLSCTVKAYWALKLAGDDPKADHMRRAREAILARGGAARANVFTRIALALFGEIPWRGTPFLPVEIVFLPRWFPFHLSKVSYWSRTVMVPLSILCSLRARARNPRGVRLAELFVTPPEDERRWFEVRSLTNRAFLALERTARRLEPLIPGFVRRRALARAERWFTERLNGEDGLGGIFPAMVNALEALVVLGAPPDDPRRVAAKRALLRLVVDEGERAWVQPCLSPVWDTALACLALLEADGGEASLETRRGLDWLVPLQLGGEPGDWREARPGLAGGGWAFEYANPCYPDLDDTAAVGWAMCLADRERYAAAIDRAADWLRGMRSRNGGFAAFDADNTCELLNEIPFADHGALLDPPTADVSARCLAFLALAAAPRARARRDGRGRDAVLAACLAYLEREQEATGAWFGRWGTNYVYGTWSVLSALELAGVDPARPMVRRAVAWLRSVQRADGGWGEDNGSYFAAPGEGGRGPESTSFQTAWAVLALLAAGEARSDAVRRGVEWLLARQRPDGSWWEPWYTAPGFPRVFYLKYHGYDDYFPLWALARYRNLAGDRSA